MIFHLLYDIQTQFPTYTIIGEGVINNDIQEYILLRESTGSSEGYPDNRIDAQVQVIVNDQDQFTCRTKAVAIFDYLRERHNITLVPHPDDVSGTPSLFIRRVAAIQPPASNGRQSNGTFQYSNNYVLTYQSPVV
jgi:hypothetical protein